ncbi:uncharacterized protein [Miscanthus floridulus]|uniref:uncharacterized protein isoform X2 n=1 Tax=Miscanthus floridulus TaxID=154761 RepID=UPI00345A4EE1
MNHQTISATRWLKYALWFLEVLDINVTTSEVVNAEGHQEWRCNIAFDIPTRGVTAGERKKVDLKGQPKPNQIDAEFNTVRKCLRKLKRIGYQVPDYSLFKIWDLERSSDVAKVSKRIAKDNQIDVILLNNYTYAACGLQAILEQAIEQLGYCCDYDGYVDTTGGYQYRLKLTLELASKSLAVGYIYGQPCLRVCEARESALMWALKYIDIDRRYTIRDIHYYDYIKKKTSLGL